jgi:hypothetical protein
VASDATPEAPESAVAPVVGVACVELQAAPPDKDNAAAKHEVTHCPLLMIPRFRSVPCGEARRPSPPAQADPRPP